MTCCCQGSPNPHVIGNCDCIFEVVPEAEKPRRKQRLYWYQDMKLTQYQLQQQMGVRYREDIGKWIRFKIKKEPV